MQINNKWTARWSVKLGFNNYLTVFLFDCGPYLWPKLGFMAQRKIYVALPALAEAENLPVFLESLRQQQYKDFVLYVCVNQPEAYWRQADKQWHCENNLRSLELLSQVSDLPLVVIDKASPGKAWVGKKQGVGWARKTLIDAIMEQAAPDDLIVSLDADTHFGPAYLQSVVETMNLHPKATALAVPYYHPLGEDEKANRAILRYEIYMRNYNINLWRIQSPYRFTALGSAIVVPVWACRKIGGMSPKLSGEDFYFLQKLRKAGPMQFYNVEKVYPAARFSDRVFFGTGPAMIKGRDGDWASYPIYHPSLFDAIQQTYCCFPLLFKEEVKTPMDAFFQEIYGAKSIWAPLRANHKTETGFVKAAHHKVDGLRLLQFLKRAQEGIEQTNEACLSAFFRREHAALWQALELPPAWTFESLTVAQLDQIRDALVQIETHYQKNDISR